MKSHVRKIGACVALSLPLIAQADILAVSFSGLVFDVNSGTAAATQIAATGSQFNSLAGDGSTFWSVSNVSGLLSTIDKTTGAATLGPALSGIADPTSIRGLTYLDGALYGLQNNGGNTSIGPDSLYRIDISSGAATLIGATGASGLQALAADASGTLFGWDVGAGLMTISTTTGAASDVDLTVGGGDIQGLAFSPSGVLYGARNELYTVDTGTGALSLVATLSGAAAGDLRGIEFTSAVPEPGSWALMATGLVLLASAARRRRP